VQGINLQLLAHRDQFVRVRNEFQAGLFVAAIILLFAGSLFFIGKEKQMFARQETYTTTFRDVKGLSPGAPIRLGGITIGRVSDIDFAPNPSDPVIVVTLLVNEKFTTRLHEGARVLIDTQGLLGDRFLSITTGTTKRVIPKGAEIPSEDSKDLSSLFETVKAVVDRTSRVSDNIDQVVSKVKDEGLPHFVDLTKSLANIAAEIEKGDGVLHTLVFNKEGAELIHSTKKLVDALSRSSHDIEGIVGRIKNGNSLAHDLFFAESPQDLGIILQKLSATADNLKVASDALRSGTGSLGALLVDPTLYDNLVEITDGAKRSFFLRQLIKQSLKKNEN
jgi:phospholipid/cholesterol/gamma-HCH transport system substrate-binding protein